MSEITVHQCPPACTVDREHAFDGWTTFWRIEAAGHIPELLTALEARASELLDVTHRRIVDLTMETWCDDREPEPSAADEYEDRRDHERAHSPGRLG